MGEEVGEEEEPRTNQNPQSIRLHNVGEGEEFDEVPTLQMDKNRYKPQISNTLR